MDIEKLIERLSEYSEPVIAYKLDADFAASITDAISELRCKCDGCSVPATTAEMIWDLNDAPKLRAENEKLRAELEQVKRMFPGCAKCEYEDDGEPMRIYYPDGWDNGIGFEYGKAIFCPECGKPLTDEAVEMVMERWKEALE